MMVAASNPSEQPNASLDSINRLNDVDRTLESLEFSVGECESKQNGIDNSDDVDCDTATPVLEAGHRDDEGSENDEQDDQKEVSVLATPDKIHKCLGSVKHFPQLLALLPHGFKHRVCEYTELESFQGQEDRFYVIFRVSAHTEEKAVRWLEKFQLSSKTTWRVDKTYPEAKTKLIFKKEYHCQHNTRSWSHKDRPIKAAHKKNTNCQAKLTITVKKFPKKSKTVDPHAPKFAMIVALKHSHNHLIDAVDALRHRPVAPEIKLKFLRMFAEGMTPLVALAKHRQDLKDQFEGADENYRLAVVDRSCCPDVQWCYRLYYKMKGKYEQPLTPHRLTSVKTAVASFINKLCVRLRADPKTFLLPIERFLSTLQTISDDSDLAAAFSAFTVPLNGSSGPDCDALENGEGEEGLNRKRKRGRPKKGEPPVVPSKRVKKGSSNGAYTSVAAAAAASLMAETSSAHQGLIPARVITIPSRSVFGSAAYLPQGTTVASVLPSTTAVTSSSPSSMSFIHSSTTPATSRLFTDIQNESWNAVLSSYAGGGGISGVTNASGHFPMIDEMQYVLCEEMAMQQQQQQQPLLHTGQNFSGGQFVTTKFLRPFF